MEEENNLSEVKKKGIINPKVFIIGLPLFIIQLVAVYFITANILLSKIDNNRSDAHSDTTSTESPEDIPITAGKYIHSIEDIIVNPAETEGKRLLLTSIGFDVLEEESFNEMVSKDILLKDIIINTLSSKSLMQLSGPEYKDSLKLEISLKVKKMLPSIKLNNVYISKYIIQ